MTFLARPQSSAYYPINPLPIVSPLGSTAGGTATWYLFFNFSAVGASFDYYLSDDAGFTSLPPLGFDIPWFVPANIDTSGYYVRLTVNSGTGPTTGSTGSWQILAAYQWTWVRATNGTTSGNYTIEIASDSGGSNVVTSVTGDFNFVKS
jgi:hypothetical protein